MSLFSSGVGDFFGLDIGSTAVRAVHLRGGPDAPKQLVAYASQALDHKLASSDADEDRQRIGQIVAEFIANSGIKTKSVVVGVPSKQVYSTVVDAPAMNKNELANSIPFLSEQYIPVPIDQVKLDYVPIGQSPAGQDKQEIFVAAAKKQYLENRLQMIEDIGLNVIAIEPDALAISRSVLAPNVLDATVIIDIGSVSTDVVLVFNQAPRLTRALPIGSETIVKSVTNSLNVEKDQARQFIEKFGFDGSKLEGQVNEALSVATDNLLSEITKSIKFFIGRYSNVAVSKVVLGGYAAVLPQFPNHITTKLEIASEVANPWINIVYTQAQAEQLAALSSQFGVAVGLAQWSQKK
jgi:type IV pilus assembly protein PilM